MDRPPELDIDWSESGSGSEGDSDLPLDLGDYAFGRSEGNTVPGGQTSSRRRGQRRDREQRLDEDVEHLIQRATAEFTSGHHDSAIKLAEEAISIDGSARIAYNLLTAIYDDRGDAQRALLAKVAATHLNKRSKDDWVEIAERSMELGLLSQAAVFFQHASRVARDDWTLLLRRAEVHQSLGEYTRSLTLLQRITKKFCDKIENGQPVISDAAKTQVLLLTARVLKQSGQLDLATELYLDIYNRSLDPARFGQPTTELNWQNLNVLCELLYDQSQYSRAVTVTRNGARWILGRGSERWWLTPPLSDGDAEFDDRRLERHVPHLSEPERYELPIDIRVWLLVCRLKEHERTYSEEDAVVHLRFLQQCVPVEEYSDLYVRAASAFFQARLWKYALELYAPLTEVPWDTLEEYLAMNIGVARCEMELGHDIRHAEQLLLHVLSRDENNAEAMISLAEIYDSTERKIDKERMLVRLREARERSGSASAPSERPHPTTAVVLVENSSSLRGASRPNRAERAENERKAQLRADAAFDGLLRYETGLESGNAVAAHEWLHHSHDLVHLFSSHRKFFPADRNKPLLGDARIGDRVSQLQIAQEGAEEEYSQEDTSQKSSNELVFRGRSLDAWFNVFMRTALAQAEYGDMSGALETLRVARAANVFSLDDRRSQVIDLVQLSCAWHARDGITISDTLRHMYMQHQFSPTVLTLYLALLGRSPAAFGTSNNQKFFLRQIKAVDQAVHGESVPGAARIISRPPKSELPLLFLLYAFIMLLGPSYVPALTYLSRAHEHLTNHPLVLMTLAVVQVQRAIQRVSTNRHIQILEALSYMQSYVAARKSSEVGRQEANYNMGRFFHGIGLFTLAVHFYEQVFESKVDQTFDLSREAAYNLHLIYALSGNMQKAREVVSSHLVV